MARSNGQKSARARVMGVPDHISAPQCIRTEYVREIPI